MDGSRGVWGCAGARCEFATRRHVDYGGCSRPACFEFAGRCVRGMPPHDLRTVRSDANGAGERPGDGWIDRGELYA
jgi:hypothetical protein